MEFVIQKSDLERELQTVPGVVEKRATIPILANLLLETGKKGLKVGASDMEVTIQGIAKATVVQEGSVTLPAAKLHEIARSLPESEVRFKLHDRNIMAISCERTRYKISGQSRSEFPSFPKIDENSGIRLPAKKLNQMIERVAFAITREDPRYSLNGALFLLEDGKLTLVATDGHRLAFVAEECDVAVGDQGPQSVIVPRKALAEVSKLSADLSDEDHILFGKTDHQVFFVVKDHKLTTSLLEGNFPRYENVMPDSCETSIMVPTEELAQAVRRVSLLASDRYGRVIKVALTDGKLDLSSKTEMGEAQETLNIDYTGPEISIGFNARYLQDYLTVVGSPAVKLELNPSRPSDDDRKTEAGDKPGQFRPEPAESGDYRYIVMPMHL
jgi:DNA polymerase-3 subunit beta